MFGIFVTLIDFVMLEDFRLVCKLIRIFHRFGYWYKFIEIHEKRVDEHPNNTGIFFYMIKIGI